jgi:hypothetical protein
LKLLAFAFAAAALASAQPSAEQILDRFIEVSGGQAAYRKLQNEVQKGELGLSGSENRATFQTFDARSGQQLFVFTMAGAGSMQGIWNGTAWENSDVSGPRIFEGVEKEYAIRSARLFRMIEWRGQYDKVEFAGKEKVGDADCLKVVLTPKSGKAESRWFDEKTGLLVKIAEYSFIQGELRLSETTFSDYRKASGILVPFRVVAKVGELTMEMDVKSVEYNQPLPAAVFEPPAAVKKLMQEIRSGTALPNAKTILARAAEAAGGEEAQKTVKTQTLIGKLVLPAVGISGTMTMYLGERGQIYQVIEMPGAGKVEVGNNGDVEWERSTLMGPKVKRVASSPGDLLQPIPTSLAMGGKYSKVETKGVDTVNGKPCYKVDQWPVGAGAVQTVCYDRETYLPVQLYVESGKTMAKLLLGDYRAVGAVKLPFLMSTETNGQTIRIEIEKITLNDPLPKEAIELPEEIEKLANQRTPVEIREVEVDKDRPTLQRKKKP